MVTDYLDGAMFADMVRGGTVRIYNNRKIVDDLNVFPIPDGDTGENMYMTVNAGVSAVKGTEKSIGEISSAISKGMLLGARGNSGVILSRFFAGVAAGFADVSDADLNTIARAFKCGVKEAYNSVAKPVEGTILTVMKDAVLYAENCIAPGFTIIDYFECFIKELRESLDRTPNLLDVLKKAGVVDSGGAGFLYIAEGMNSVLNENDTKESYHVNISSDSENPDISSFTSDSVLEFGYCTEFLLRIQKSKCDIALFDINKFTEELNKIGESVVAFQEDSVVKVHVHTMYPGRILDFGQQYGEFLTLKIENMMLQHNEVKTENKSIPHKKYAVVAVAAGQGVKDMFSELGADYVVDGGQSMNPSVKDFINAFEQLDADTIFVYPNNSNVILTANQAAEIYEKSKIKVIKSKTIGDGYVSLSMFDYESDDADALIACAEDIISDVVTGIVSKANKDADGKVTVRSGDFIGFTDGIILVDEPNKNEALYKLAACLDVGSRDVVLVISGENTSNEESKQAIEVLKEKYKKTEIIYISGQQPVYDFILVLT